MALLLSRSKVYIPKSSTVFSSAKPVTRANKRSFETFVERTFKYRELSASALENELKNNPSEVGVWSVITKNMESPPAQINAQSIKEIVNAPKRLFGVINNYLNMTKESGMPLWYELQVDPNKNDSLLPWDQLLPRAGLHIGDVGDASSFAETLFLHAWEKDPKMALQFSDEAKNFMLAYASDPSGFAPLLDPLFPLQKKMDLLGRYFKNTPANNLFSSNMQLLLLSLVSEDKLSYLPYVLRGVFMLGWCAQGGILGSVTTATALPAKARVDFTEATKKELLTPKDNLVLQFKDNPEIGGGYLLAIPTKGMYNRSWGNVFTRFSQVQQNAVNHIIQSQYKGVV